jgi:acetylornithine deacetylase/succinyl-diaminopimelate desuccinylase-like protein
MQKLLTELIQNRCVNPPGNEMRSIKLIERYLCKQGVKSRVYKSAPNRGNLVARILGSGDGPNLMFGPGHVDVVPVDDVDAWDEDPFSATIKEGYIWGRGSHDMLFMVAAHVQAFIDLKNSGLKPKGDLILLVVSDEEGEGTYGLKWMLEYHPEEVHTDYACSEAGGWLNEQGSVVFTYGEKMNKCTSPVDSIFVTMMEEAIQREMPYARVVPEIMPGKTDLRLLRKIGVEAYGFGLYDPDTPPQAMKVHGPNERLSLKTLELTHKVYTHLADILNSHQTTKCFLK